MENGDQIQKPKNFWPGFLTGVLATVAFFALIGIVVLVMLISRGKAGIEKSQIEMETQRDLDGASESEADNQKSLDLDKIDAKLKLLQKLVGKYYLFDEDQALVEDGIYAGMMDALGDPYTVYYTEEEYQSLMESTSGKYSGIGAMVSQDPDTGIVTIVKVYEGTPSKEAGLLEGDIVYKVDDIEATGTDLDLLVSNHIRGEDNTQVVLTVLRGEEREEIEITVTRRAIEIPTVESKMLDGGIGYIAVAQFDEVTSGQFESAVDDLTDQGMTKLIIDLRGNPGGLIDSCVEMLDYMLPDGLLVYTADKNGAGNKYNAYDGHEVDMPTVILVDGNSASASEIFSGAYKDYEKATLVGTKTFGKGIVQNVIPLGDGTAIKITTQHYYTPTGFDLHGKGIEPDITVEADEGAVAGTDTDNQLKKAVEVLNGE